MRSSENFGKEQATLKLCPLPNIFTAWKHWSFSDRLVDITRADEYATMPTDVINYTPQQPIPRRCIHQWPKLTSRRETRTQLCDGCRLLQLWLVQQWTFSYKNIRRDACMWWWEGGLLMWYDHVTCTAAVTCTFNSFLSSVSLNINNHTNCQH